MYMQLFEINCEWYFWSCVHHL